MESARRNSEENSEELAVKLAKGPVESPVQFYAVITPAAYSTIMTTEIVGELYPDLIASRKLDADYVIESLNELL